MVTLALLALLSTLAAPSFIDQRRSSELTSVANEFIASIYAVRSEAMKRNMNGLLMPKNQDNNWNSGWIAFVDVDSSATYNSGDILIMESEAVSSNIAIDSTGTAKDNPAYLFYNGSGFIKDKNGASAQTTIQMQRKDSATTRNTRRIIIAKTGRVRICTPMHLTTDTDCSKSDTE